MSSRSLPGLACLLFALAATAGPVGVLPRDWLVDPAFARAQARVGEREVVLENGLLRRTIAREPGVATVGLDNLMTGNAALRAVEPEAVLVLSGREHRIGGLDGQRDRAYLPAGAVAGLTNPPSAFRLSGVRQGVPTAPLEWRRRRHAADLAWPPRGAAVELDFTGTDETTRGLSVTVHHELLDGLPVLSKWLVVSNHTGRAVTVDRCTVERLAMVEAESAVDERPGTAWRTPAVDVLSDYMFKGMDAVTGNQVASWRPDPAYGTQVSYERRTPCLLVCEPPSGPGVVLEPGGVFTSFRVHLVVHDSYDRERQGLALRRATRALAPWTTENPVMMHVRSADRKTFRNAVDQCVETGFEMIIYTFGSGLDMEREDPAYLESIRQDVAYAHGKGVEVGAYSLFSSRRIDDANDVVNPKTGRPGGAIFGNAPCFGSRWGTNYLRRLTNFISVTGLDLLEHDGPYPGDPCASTNHPAHHGLEDSQWVNWKMSADLYAWCRARGVYVNQPDYYFLAGGSKTGMGYREDNWSLPRAQQMVHARQNIFDGTWTKPQTAGWMMVPLTEYHGGGPAATIEPMREHLPDYEAHLANTLGSGVQACWRGPRLYDASETRDLVRRWVTWFKAHRTILESDIVHVRRADGRDLDYVVHVDPKGKERAFSVVHNPLPGAVTREVVFPLYYSGLRGTAHVRVADGRPERVRLDEAGRARVTLTVPASGRTWVSFAP